jgi:hypothetical protein
VKTLLKAYLDFPFVKNLLVALFFNHILIQRYAKS